MLKIILYLLCGIACGVLAGMGMGGGTILIPSLTIFFNINQRVAQGVNLVAFIPMAIVALIIHLKNKLLNFKGVLYIIIPALICAYLGFELSKLIETDVLQKCFGGFLILLSVVQILQIKFIKNDKKN